MEPREVIDKFNEVLALCHLAGLTDKKVRTHGGEWVGPCPRCKKLTGNGGQDRLRVNPTRPIEGHGSREYPIFVCRRCKRHDDSSKDWSGDFPEFVREALNISYGAARAWLGLAPGGGEIKPKMLEPTPSLTPGAPCLEWQTEGGVFVKSTHAWLFESEGEKAMQGLIKSRGIPGDVMKEDQWGWQDNPALFVDGAAWGQTGRMRIPRGLVIPEYHRGKNGQIELWSIAIRRTKQDIQDEEAEYTVEEIARGKRAQRYWLVRGSQKSLYGAESIKPGCLVVLSEGQINAVTVQYAGRGEFAFAATQGASSGQADPRILGYWLSRARGVILMMDPDGAGQKAYEFWAKALADSSIDHRPLTGDLNDMLVNKGPDAVYKFLDRGRRKFEKIFGTVAGSASETQQAALPGSDVLRDRLDTQGHFSAFSEPISEIPAQKGEEEEAPLESISALIHEFSTKCKRCGDNVVMYDAEAQGWCQHHRPDKTREMCDYNGCSNGVVHRNTTGYGWCNEHFASYQLMEYGETMRSGNSWTPYLPVDIGAGRGVVSAGSWDETGSDNAVWVKTRRSQIEGGEQKYFRFACSADPAQIWAAASEVRCICAGLKKRKAPKFYAHPCMHRLCFNDAAKPVQVFWDTYKDDEGREVLKHPAWKGHVVYTERHGALEFCGTCTDAAYLLELAEMRGYKGYKSSPYEIDGGEDEWVDFCMNEDLYRVGAVFDKMKREYVEEWRRVMEIVHPE